MKILTGSHLINELASQRDRLVRLLQLMTFKGVVDLNVLILRRFGQKDKLNNMISDLGGADTCVNDVNKMESIKKSMSETQQLSMALQEQQHDKSYQKSIKIENDISLIMSKMEAQLSEQRLKTANSEKMAQIMLDQNMILMQQVNQMNAMQLEVKLFMNRFPMSNQQAEIQ